MEVRNSSASSSSVIVSLKPNGEKGKKNRGNTGIRELSE